MSEIYISTDIETDGPIPGVNSMLSFASAAFKPDKTRVGTFSANLETLPGAAGDPRTMAWWQTQPEAWAACRTNLREPAEAMRSYVDWIAGLGGKPVFVAYPAGFDFLFVYWYLIRFTGASPFSHSALDIKTYAMAVLQTEYRASTKRNMPGTGSTTCRTRTLPSTTRSARDTCSATCSPRTAHARHGDAGRPGPSWCEAGSCVGRSSRSIESGGGACDYRGLARSYCSGQGTSAPSCWAA